MYAHHQGLPDFTVEENRAEMVCYRDTRESVRACFDREMEQLLQIHRQLIRKATYIIRSIVKVICPCSFEWYFMPGGCGPFRYSSAYGQYPEHDNIPKLKPALRLEALNRYVANLGEKNRRNEMICVHRCTRGVRWSAGRGLFRMTVQSDPGKTTAVMAYQLKQAVAKGARRFLWYFHTQMLSHSQWKFIGTLWYCREKNGEAVVAELHCKADFEDEDTRCLTSCGERQL